MFFVIFFFCFPKLNFSSSQLRRVFFAVKFPPSFPSFSGERKKVISKSSCCCFKSNFYILCLRVLRTCQKIVVLLASQKSSTSRSISLLLLLCKDFIIYVLNFFSFSFSQVKTCSSRIPTNQTTVWLSATLRRSTTRPWRMNFSTRPLRVISSGVTAPHPPEGWTTRYVFSS